MREPSGSVVCCDEATEPAILLAFGDVLLFIGVADSAEDSASALRPDATVDLDLSKVGRASALRSDAPVEEIEWTDDLSAFGEVASASDSTGAGVCKSEYELFVQHSRLQYLTLRARFINFFNLL